MVFKCVTCSTKEHRIFVNGIKKNDGFIHCEICGSIELEQVVK